MISRPGDTDTRSMAERLDSRVHCPLKAALYAAEDLLGEGSRIAKALASVRRELQKEIDALKTPLKKNEKKTAKGA